jgi:hypothetical protein
MSGNPFDCVRCEEVMQPYMDRILSATEMREVEGHLDRCRHCRGAYRLEEQLHVVVRKAADEHMDPELKRKLIALRTPLVDR